MDSKIVVGPLVRVMGKKSREREECVLTNETRFAVGTTMRRCVLYASNCSLECIQLTWPSIDGKQNL